MKQVKSAKKNRIFSGHKEQLPLLENEAQSV